MYLVHEISSESYRAATSDSNIEDRKKLYRELENELDSKPVMPEAFDSYWNWRVLGGWSKDRMVNEIYEIVFFDDYWKESEPLRNWIRTPNNVEKSLRKFNMCVSAILDDYEVEK